MSKYTVYMDTTASLAVHVEIDDSGMDERQASEAAIEAAYSEAPRGICAQCSGWGEQWSLDLGGWEPAEDTPTTRES